MKTLRCIISPVLILALFCACNGQDPSSRRKQERPNIIFLLTDDQAYNTVGYSGNGQVKTPNIDRLAQDGIWFNNYYCTTSICMGSRATYMTGMYEYKTGCNFMHGPLSKDKFAGSYPELLQEAGYRTGFAGKFGFAVKEDPNSGSGYNDYGVMPVDEFDWWAGGPGQTKYETAQNKYIARYAEECPHSSRSYGAAAQDFIKESVMDGRPFCLSVSFKAPHGPLSPDPVFDTVYENTIFDKPVNYGRESAGHLALQSKLGRQYLRLFGGDYMKKFQESYRKYHQLIYGVDYAVGMIREELERQGIADNTVIIFTSDNGYNLGSHGFGGKVLPYEEGCRAPLIVFDPRSRSAGEKWHNEAVTGNTDIAPTIIELAGLPVPENMDGESLLPALEDPDVDFREALPVIQAWGSAPNLAFSLVTEEWKYIYWYFGDNMDPAEELFDLRNDPYEMKNMVAEESAKKVLEDMRKLYDSEIQRWKDEAVTTGHYKEFGTLFDRHVPWAQKEDLIPGQFLKVYSREVEHTGYSGAPDNYSEVIKHLQK